MFLAGDIGGTSTRLRLYSCKENYFCVEAAKNYESAKCVSLESAIQNFLQENDALLGGNAPDALCVGVPGPVQNGAVQLTNLPWVFSEESIRETLRIERVQVVNDLYSLAAAVPHLSSTEKLVIHPGGNCHGDKVYTVVAPGTGLGHASAVRLSDGNWEILGSEGGHLDFAPRDPLTVHLLQYLQSKFNGRVSYERVLSGPGLRNIYDFLGTLPEYQDSEPHGFIPESDAPRMIAELGLSGQSDRAVKALDVFARILGWFAGNCVLYNLSTGGVFLGGGIPPKLVTKLQDGALVDEYLKQGRMSPLVGDAPLVVILNDDAGLLGSAVLAQRLLVRQP
ncbi:MAG: glucokinase [Bdellovibrionales bacterium]|nr:glucokinase [Bdellovibrionales bacterium]